MPNTKKIFILQGLPASGKSTYAQTLTKRGFIRVNKDCLREMFTFSQFSHHHETLVIETEYYLVEQLMKAKENIVVDDTNFNWQHVNKYCELSKTYGYEVELKTFDTPLEECIARDERRDCSVCGRGTSVGRAVIEEMAATFTRENEFSKKTLPADTDLVIIADLHLNHHRLIEFGEREEGFSERLLANLQAFPGEYLINLGDIVFGQRHEKLAWLGKYLEAIAHFSQVLHIYGNHDTMLPPAFAPSQLGMERSKPRYYMDEIGGDKYYKAEMVFAGTRILFSHLPLAAELLEDYDLNIHGHIHTVKSMRLEESQEFLTDKHVLISMEYQDLQPVTLKQVLANLDQFRTLELVKKYTT